jgi:hypothetical protein
MFGRMRETDVKTTLRGMLRTQRRLVAYAATQQSELLHRHALAYIEALQNVHQNLFGTMIDE